MRKLKKSTGLTLALLIYVSATAAYFLPRNTEISSTEKYITVAASYLIVLALWLVLRKKEEYRRRQLEENRRYQAQKQENRNRFYFGDILPCRQA